MFVQADVLTDGAWLDYLMILLNHVSWASVFLDVSLYLSSHLLRALLQCDGPVSACVPAWELLFQVGLCFCLFGQPVYFQLASVAMTGTALNKKKWMSEQNREE